MAPWQYTNNSEAAMNSLVAVATGKKCLSASLMVSYIADQLQTACQYTFRMCASSARWRFRASSTPAAVWYIQDRCSQLHFERIPGSTDR